MTSSFLLTLIFLVDYFPVVPPCSEILRISAGHTVCLGHNSALNMKVVHFLVTSGTNYPNTLHNNPEELFPKRVTQWETQINILYCWQNVITDCALFKSWNWL